MVVTNWLYNCISDSVRNILGYVPAGHCRSLKTDNSRCTKKRKRPKCKKCSRKRKKKCFSNTSLRHKIDEMSKPKCCILENTLKEHWKVLHPERIYRVANMIQNLKESNFSGVATRKLDYKFWQLMRCKKLRQMKMKSCRKDRKLQRELMEESNEIDGICCGISNAFCNHLIQREHCQDLNYKQIRVAYYIYKGLGFDRSRNGDFGDGKEDCSYKSSVRKVLMEICQQVAGIVDRNLKPYKQQPEILKLETVRPKESNIISKHCFFDWKKVIFKKDKESDVCEDVYEYFYDDDSDESLFEETFESLRSEEHEEQLPFNNLEEEELFSKYEDEITDMNLPEEKENEEQDNQYVAGNENENGEEEATNAAEEQEEEQGNKDEDVDRAVIRNVGPHLKEPGISAFDFLNAEQKKTTAISDKKFFEEFTIGAGDLPKTTTTVYGALTDFEGEGEKEETASSNDMLEEDLDKGDVSGELDEQSKQQGDSDQQQEELMDNIENAQESSNELTKDGLVDDEATEEELPHQLSEESFKDAEEEEDVMAKLIQETKDNGNDGKDEELLQSLETDGTHEEDIAEIQEDAASATKEPDEVIEEELEEEKLEDAPIVVHPDGTSSYVAWCLYVSWLNEFARNIETYSNCLQKFRAILKEGSSSDRIDMIRAILNNWIDYLGQSRVVDASMAQYFRDKPLSWCSYCRVCTIDDFPANHEIPPALAEAIRSTLRWRKMLQDAEVFCNMIDEEGEESGSNDPIDICDVNTSSSSSFTVSPLSSSKQTISD